LLKVNTLVAPPIIPPIIPPTKAPKIGIGISNCPAIAPYTLVVIVMPTDKLIPNIFYIFFLVSISALFNILKA
jgi:hypothetical protein